MYIKQNTYSENKISITDILVGSGDCSYGNSWGGGGFFIWEQLWGGILHMIQNIYFIHVEKSLTKYIEWTIKACFEFSYIQGTNMVL